MTMHPLTLDMPLTLIQECLWPHLLPRTSSHFLGIVKSVMVIIELNKYEMEFEQAISITMVAIIT